MRSSCNWLPGLLCIGSLFLCAATFSCAGANVTQAPTGPRTPKGSGSELSAQARVTVTNASRETLCAEEDNVYVKLHAAGLTGMQIEARQPSYIGQLKVDDSKADFSDCHFTDDENPVYHFEPKRIVLFEDEHWLLLGNTYETFWRPNQVPVVVNGKVTEGLHLLQLHKKDPSERSAGRHEFLVLYPPDGYWRAKPIPAQALPSSTYGTSFLVGPVIEAKRPVVELSRVEFVPAKLTFELDYADGSHGSMQLVAIDRERLALTYRHDRSLVETQPMAAIRSMFVSPEKADVSEVTLLADSASAATTVPISSFTQQQTSEVTFGRSVVSGHNPSAPDMWFGAFATGTQLPSRE